MNLAQCIASDWAQSLPASGPTVHPSALDWSRITTHEGGISTARVLGQATRPVVEPVERALVVRRPAPAAPVAAPVRTQRSRWEARRRSASNPWPRGKSGLRFRILTAIRGARDTGLHLSDLAARLAGWSSAQLSMELRNMVLDGWLARRGVSRHYRYTLTPAGNAALDWPG